MEPMTKTAQLKRPGPTGLEGRTNRLIALVWLLLWAVVGAGVRLGFGEWHGFFWGFIVAGVVAVVGVWNLYARPMTNRKCSATLTWLDGALVVKNNRSQETVRVQVDQPHRVLLIRSRAERAVMLRVDQVDENNKSGQRLDLLGPLPIVLPVKVNGEALSFMGFQPGVRKRVKDDKIPYQLCASGGEANTLMTDLLGFLDCHQGQRKDTLNLRSHKGIVRLDKTGFIVVTDTGQTRLDFKGDVTIACVASPMESAKLKKGTPPLAKVFIALIPGGAREDALVFELLAAHEWLEELPDTWEVPDSATENRVLLYDDTPTAFVAQSALRRYVKKFDPSSPIYEILRS